MMTYSAIVFTIDTLVMVAFAWYWIEKSKEGSDARLGSAVITVFAFINATFSLITLICVAGRLP